MITSPIGYTRSACVGCIASEPKLFGGIRSKDFYTLRELLDAALGGGHELIDLGGGQVARIAGKPGRVGMAHVFL